MASRIALDDFDVERRPFSIVILNRRTRMTDGESCIPRAIGIPHMVAGCITEWPTVWKPNLKFWY